MGLFTQGRGQTCLRWAIRSSRLVLLLGEGLELFTFFYYLWLHGRKNLLPARWRWGGQNPNSGTGSLEDPLRDLVSHFWGFVSWQSLLDLFGGDVEDGNLNSKEIVMRLATKILWESQLSRWAVSWSGRWRSSLSDSLHREERALYPCSFSVAGPGIRVYVGTSQSSRTRGETRVLTHRSVWWIRRFF